VVGDGELVVRRAEEVAVAEAHRPAARLAEGHGDPNLVEPEAAHA